jgi:predicted PurR-regulated permease PerM
MLVIFIAPLLLTIGTLVDNSERIAGFVQLLAAFNVPPPPEWVRGLPLVGTRVAERWMDIAAAGKEDLAARIAPYAAAAAQWLAAAVGSVGVLLIQFLLTVIVAVILYANGEVARAKLIGFGRRLAGARGERVIVLAGQAIRAVAMGVVVTALVQTALAGVGLAVAGVPFAGILSAVVLLLCIAQLGPLPVLAPAVAWLYWSGRPGWGTALLVWTIGVAVLDNVLRPLLIRRGAKLPLLLIFAGVIGGLIAFGVIGLFIGPVVLAVAHTLLGEWASEREPV